MKRNRDLPEIEWNFDSVKTLPAHQQRACVDYEYARTTKVGRQTGISLRKWPDIDYWIDMGHRWAIVGKFSEFPKAPFLKISEKTREESIPDHFGVECFRAEIPQKYSFWDMDKKVSRGDFLKENGQEIRELRPMFENWPKNSLFAQQYQMTIDWFNLSDKQLLEDFEQWLIKNRPKSMAKPSKPGRNANDQEYGSPIDALRQLAVYRFTVNGCSYEQAYQMGFKNYVSESDKGWKAALAAAKLRMKKMFEDTMYPGEKRVTKRPILKDIGQPSPEFMRNLINESVENLRRKRKLS